MRRFLFSGEGRLDRLGYLIGLLTAAVLFVAPAVLLLAGQSGELRRFADPAIYRQAAMTFGAVCWLVVVWIYCAVTSRRLHDMNRSGWLAVLGLFPVIGLGAMTLLLLLAPGSAGVNRYGARWL